MSDVCKACDKKLTPRHTVPCSLCNSKFHPNCVDNPINRDNWTCKACLKICDSKSTSTMPNNITGAILSQNNMESSDIKLVLQSLVTDLELLKNKHIDLSESVKAISVIESQNLEFSQTLNVIQSKCEMFVKMSDSIMVLESKVAELDSKNKCLGDEVSKLRSRVSNIENNIYNACVEIKGIPFSKNEILYEIFKNIMGVLKLEMNLDCIKKLRRSRLQNGISSIYVEFTNTYVKENLIASYNLYKEKLTTSSIGFKDMHEKIFIRNFLPGWKKKLYFDSQVLRTKPFNYKYIWINDGNILCKKDDKSKTLRILSNADLEQLLLPSQNSNTDEKTCSAAAVIESDEFCMSINEESDANG